MRIAKIILVILALSAAAGVGLVQLAPDNAASSLQEMQRAQAGLHRKENRG